MGWSPLPDKVRICDRMSLHSTWSVVVEKICESLEGSTPLSIPKLGSVIHDEEFSSPLEGRLEIVEPPLILVLQSEHALPLGFEVEVRQTCFVTGLLGHLERLTVVIGVCRTPREPVPELRRCYSQFEFVASSHQVRRLSNYSLLAPLKEFDSTFGISS